MIDTDSPFRFLFNDLVPTNNYIAASSTATGYNVNALGDTDRQTVHMPGAVTSYGIEFRWAASQTIKGIAICNHNLYSMGITNFQWQRYSGGWITEETVTLATLADSGDDDFFLYSSCSSDRVRLLINSSGSLSGTYIGRIFIADNTFYVGDTSHAFPVEGSGAGSIKQGERFQTLTGLEHSTPRGGRTQRHVWAFDRLGSTDAGYFKWLDEELGFDETFILSDPEEAGDKDYGRAIHVRMTSPNFFRNWQVASREACLLDVTEVL